MWAIALIAVLLIAILLFLIMKGYKKAESYRETSLVQNYLRQVYPLASSLDDLDIEFLYSCAPRSEFGDKFLDPAASGNFEPPPLNQWWRPVWFNSDSYALNLYPPDAWWEYKYLDEYQDNWNIEAIHTRDDNPLYPVYGLWVYVAKGTGVYYNVGRTVLAKNKIHALYLLGMSIPEIADYLKDKHYFYNPTRPYESYYGGVEAIDYIINVNRNYDLDRFNNTADIDQIIAEMAAKQGYDSVQFQVQANGLGGWAHEMVFVSPKPLLKQSEVTWEGWPDMSTLMSIRDPHGVNSPERCDPVVVPENNVVGCCKQTLPSKCISSEFSSAGYYYQRLM